MEEKKEKRKFGDNWLVLGIKANLLMLVGETILGIIIGIFVLLPMIKTNGITDKAVFMDMVENTAFTPYDWVNTAISYLEFISIWIIFLVWFRISKNDRPLLKAIGTQTKGNNWKKLLLGFGIGFGMNGLCILLAWLHGDITLQFSNFSLLPLLLILICVFIQSSAEELVCRGYYYQRLMKSYHSPVVAAVVSSVCFAALHLANPGIGVLPMIDIIVIGVFFCMIVYYLDSFWCACAIHCAWNFTQNIIFGLPNSGRIVSYSILKLDTASVKNSIFYDVNFGIEGSLMAILVHVAACVLIYLWAKKHPTQPIDIWAEEQAAADGDAH